MLNVPTVEAKYSLFPRGDDRDLVDVYATRNEWTTIRNWKVALNRFMIEFEDRLAEYI